MKTGIIWDFDDTLVETGKNFEISRENFVCLMEEMNFPRDKVLETLDRLDIENVKKLGGFMKECFPDAMMQTYRYFCGANNISPVNDICRKVEEIGWWVFEQRPVLLPGAMEALDHLSKKYEMYLATKGDPSVQWQRIDDSGLRGYFREIYVLNSKTAGDYLRIAGLNCLSPDRSWIIGNSLKAEINPGLQAGFNCIYIPSRYTWHYEMEEPIGNYVTLDSLELIPGLLMNNYAAI